MSIEHQEGSPRAAVAEVGGYSATSDDVVGEMDLYEELISPRDGTGGAGGNMGGSPMMMPPMGMMGGGAAGGTSAGAALGASAAGRSGTGAAGLGGMGGSVGGLGVGSLGSGGGAGLGGGLGSGGVGGLPGSSFGTPRLGGLGTGTGAAGIGDASLPGYTTSADTGSILPGYSAGDFSSSPVGGSAAGTSSVAGNLPKAPTIKTPSAGAGIKMPAMPAGGGGGGGGGLGGIGGGGAGGLGGIGGVGTGTTQVSPELLRDECKTWAELKEDLQEVGELLQRTKVYGYQTGFLHESHPLYDGLWERLNRWIASGVKEFDVIGETLSATAKKYYDAEIDFAAMSEGFLP